MGFFKDKEMREWEADTSESGKNCKRCGDKISNQTDNMNNGFCDSCIAEWDKIKKE